MVPTVSQVKSDKKGTGELPAPGLEVLSCVIQRVGVVPGRYSKMGDLRSESSLVLTSDDATLKL